MALKCFGSGNGDSIFNKVIYNADGTVSGINTYIMPAPIPITAECCKTLNLNYDPIRSRCLWKTPYVTNEPFTVLISPKNDDGAYFQVQSNEICTCDLEFEYLFSWDCDKLVTLGITNQTTLQQDITDTNTAITNLYTVSNTLNATAITLQTNINALDTTILSLTAQISVLENKSSLTIAEQATLLNLKSQLSTENFNKQNTSAQLSDVQSEIVVIDYQIAAQQTTLTNLNYELTGTSTYNRMMSNFVAYSTLNVLSATTATTIPNTIVQIENTNVSGDIFEELLLDTTSDMIEYLGSLTGNTGIYLSGSTANITQVVNNLKLEAAESGITLTNSMFNSPWIKHKLSITEPEALEIINNQKLKAGIEIRSSNAPFIILLDNIKINKNCTTTKTKELYVTESPRFDLTRIPDNKKSWLSGDTQNRDFDLTRRKTQYTVNDSRLVINTKEIDLAIDAANGIESDVFNNTSYNANLSFEFWDNQFYSGNVGFLFLTPHTLQVGDVVTIVQDAGYLNEHYNGVATITAVPSNLEIVIDKAWGVSTPANPGLVYPYLIPKILSDIKPVDNTDEFIRIIVSELIDAKNRKTISDYPTLRELYDKYLGLVSNNCSSCRVSPKYTYADMDTFTNLISKHWVGLVEQVIPSTSIWGATNIIRNTVFDNNKYNYKRYSLQLSGSTFSGVGQSDYSTVVSTVTVSDITGTTTTTTGLTIGNFSEGSEFIGTLTITPLIQ